MSISYQAVQAGHAAIEWCMKSIRAGPWHEDSNYLIYLTVENERDLQSLYEALQQVTEVYPFHEPDIGNELTAISFMQDQKTKSFTRKLSLL